MPDRPQIHSPLRPNIPKHNPFDDSKLAAKRQAKRYYNTWDTEWLKIRRRILQAEPLCRECKKETPPRFTGATHVDHIDGDASTLESYRDENLQPLCKTHHSIKTAKEDGSWGNPMARGGI